jgi:acetolactate synthase-1/2/3 large subunit
MDGSGRSQRRCADAIIDTLESVGVDVITGIPGGAISATYDALVGRSAIRAVHVRHESAAGFMAIGQHKARPGALPCVFVTSGPGVTNLMTGLAAAHGERTPMLVIAGEVPRSRFGRGALQEGSAAMLDVLSMVRSVTVSREELSLPGAVAHRIALGAERARAQRGPVFFTLPLDVAVATVQSTSTLARSTSEPALDEHALLAAVAELRRASNPLILVGAGARGASALVRKLSRHLGAPVISSPRAKGVLRADDPYYLGVFGYGGHTSASTWLAEHRPDVTLALGCGFSEPSTNSWSPALTPSRSLIQVDVDPSNMGRNYAVDVPVLADCSRFIEALLARVPAGPSRADLTGMRLLDADECQRDRSPLRPERVLTVLQSELPRGTVFTSDIGEHLLFAIHYLRCDDPSEFWASTALGTMGSGIGAAEGHALADRSRRVVSICGDFGFQMYGGELSTCVQEQLPVTFVVMNDSRMRMVEAGVQRIYGRGVSMLGPRVDFAAIAEAHGAKGYRVETVDELRAALRAPTTGPVVLDVCIDRTAAFAINGRVKEISNFTAK